jgi:outer membrane receptor for ferrienterochelin and colicins
MLVAKPLDEVVVSATRSEREMGALPMPVSVITQQQIKAMGSMRLTEILGEQTGLFIVNNHGNGVQMQGFNPDYTLILIDGEPLIGRTAGTLELDRLAVGNIKQIEIVKGPASSLYGSEALAGVINIITETPNKTQATASARYGSNATSDLSTTLSLRQNKTRLSVFLNRNSSQGFDHTPSTLAPTVAPHTNYTLQPKLSYAFSKNTSLTVSSRLYEEQQQNRFTLTGENDLLVEGIGKVREISLNPSLRHKIGERVVFDARLYSSRYATSTDLAYQQTAAPYERTFFRQRFLRPEIQSQITLNEKNLLTLGAGSISESVDATRYSQLHRFTTRYVFAQYEYFPTNRLHWIVGGRYDRHSAYNDQFSPKLALRYEVSKQWAVRASAGAGFKAPDFRQLYLNFTNTVAGYSVFGYNEIQAQLQQLRQRGQLAELLTDPDELEELSAERSFSVNLGATHQTSNGWKTTLNLFRNDVNNLIESQLVARTTSFQSIFSYRNLRQVYTQGLELETGKKIQLSGAMLHLTSGYQFLDAKDKAVLSALREGTLFRRDPETLTTSRVRPSEYGGLLGRSAHSANVRIFCEFKSGWGFTIRGIYRGRFGIADLNGNAILDTPEEYASGYWLWNTSLSKTIHALTVQVGTDNLLGYTDPINVPNLAGRLLWVRMSTSLGRIKHQ